MEPVLPLSPYSAECVEEEFSEVELPIYGVPRSSLAGSCIAPSLWRRVIGG